MFAPQARREGLFVACASDPPSTDDDRYFVTVCRQLRDRYRARGYRIADDDVLLGTSWDVVIGKLNAAAAAGTPYERLVTVGHGGWAGPILPGGQLAASYWEGPFGELLEAVRRGVSPTGRIFCSNCHSAGSDRIERAGDAADRTRHQRAVEAARDGVGQAEARLAAATTSDAREVAERALTLAHEELERVEEDYVGSWVGASSIRWVEELARGSGRLAAGPMGSTSTTYTLDHTDAVLEGEGAVKQETWVVDPRTGVVRHLMPGQTLAEGKTLALDALPEELEPVPTDRPAIPVWSPIDAGPDDAGGGDGW